MKCSICKNEIDKHVNPETGEVYWDQGHNAEPINDGRCCDDCNATKVLPTRLGLVFHNKITNA